jgi:2-oxoglutarate ferredoxin oxidoreductase subunit beta
MQTLQVYQPARPIWCAGCGDFGVQAALEKSIRESKIKSKDLVTLAGIGCSGTLQNNVQSYGYHALHGRVLPTAIGVKLGNHHLTVVAVGGDGDGYAIGMGHFVHALKRNASIMYVVMNNETYGLTKGQYSPTSPEGFEGNVESGVDAMLLALGVPTTTFIARGFSGYPAQLTNLFTEGLNHTSQLKGMAFVEVLSPCVTYNDTYRLWKAMIHDLEQDREHVPTDRASAFRRVTELRNEGKIPIGIVYKGTHKSLEAATFKDVRVSLADMDISIGANEKGYRELMTKFRG